MPSRGSTSGVRRIHITTLGSSATGAFDALSLTDVDDMIARVQARVGKRFLVTANAGLLRAGENDRRGGRSDDAVRIRELHRVFADDHIAALVCFRGGAWFTRLLDRIDFSRLARRRRMLHLFGFSEMTSLIGIAGRYRRVVGVHDLGPGFLPDALWRYAWNNARRLARKPKLAPAARARFADDWSEKRSGEAFLGFFADVANMLTGTGSSRVPQGRLVRGSLPNTKKITIIGGNLSVIVALLGSPLARSFDPRGKWLALEDVHESAGSLDRMLAALKLAGFFDRAEGLILGDFHRDSEDQFDAVLASLERQLPARWRRPIVRLSNFGHVHPLAPLPMHRPVKMVCNRGERGPARVTIESPWSQWSDD